MEKDFANCLYHNVSSLNRKISKLADQKFKEIDLVPTHAFLLVVVEEKVETSPTYIAGRLNLKPSTITRFLDKLCAKGYLIRSFSGKNTYVKLSKAGSAKIPLIEKKWNELNEIYDKMLSDDVQTLLGITKVCTDKLCEKSKSKVLPKITKNML